MKSQRGAMATGGCASEPRPSLSSLSWGVWVRASRPSSHHSTSANSTIRPGHGFTRGGVCSQGRVAAGSACPRLARSRTPGPGEEALLWVPPPARCRLSSWVKGCWRASADTDWDPLGARQASPTRHLWQLGFLSHFRDEETEAPRHVVTCSR